MCHDELLEWLNMLNKIKTVKSQSKAGSTCSVAVDGSGACESSRLNNVQPFEDSSRNEQVHIAG